MRNKCYGIDSRKRSKNGNKCIISLADMGLSVIYDDTLRPKGSKVNTEAIRERKIIVLLLIRLFAGGRTHIEWDIVWINMGEKASPTPQGPQFSGVNKLIEGYL